MHALGVDVGYGYTKAVSSLGKALAFPSAVGLAEAPGYHIDLNGADQLPTRGGLVTLEDKVAYFYGDKAIRASRILHQPRDRQWLRSRPYRVLWEAVVGSLVLPGTHPVIVTGLPVSYFTDRTTLGEVVRQVLAGRDITPASITVVPQPFGSFCARLLDTEGRMINEQQAMAHVGIIDIGHFTTDLMEIKELEFLQKGSGSLEVGVANVLDHIRRVAHEQWGRYLEPSECEGVIESGKVRVKGTMYDVAAICEVAFADVASAIAAFARQLWAGGEALDAVILTGGGGDLFADLLIAEFSHLSVIDSPFLANAQGFMRYALYRQQEDG